MMTMRLRKFVHAVEESIHDGGADLPNPVRKGWIAAVVSNPYAGRYVEVLDPDLAVLRELGLEMSRRLASALGGLDKIDAFGKGTVIGASGEIEHAALWHVPGGYAMREVLGKALAIVPSAVKMGGFGTTLDLPLHHKDACYVRSHFDAITMTLSDAPRPDEIVFALAMASGGRPHSRMGGLTVGGISKWDGLR